MEFFQQGMGLLNKYGMRALVCLLLIKPIFLKADEFKVDSSSSDIKWKATKVMGGHNGTLKISSGHLKFDKGQLVGGLFKADMKSIVCLDLDPEGPWNGKLVNHLKSDDFFSVEAHPYSTFKISSSKMVKEGQYAISGDLTIKGIKKPLNFKASIKVDGKKFTPMARSTTEQTIISVFARESFLRSGHRHIHDKVSLKLIL